MKAVEILEMRDWRIIMADNIMIVVVEILRIGETLAVEDR